MPITVQVVEEDFIMEAIKIKKIKKNINFLTFEEYSKNLTAKSKKFWLNNKKVSNKKIKNFFRYNFIFPDYKSGLKNLKEYL